MKNILIDAEIYDKGLEQLKRVTGIGVDVIEPCEELRELPAELLRDKHILFCSVPPKNLDDMRSLELIQITSAGYSQLFGLDLPRRNIRACNGRGVFDVTIAEWNIAMMINLSRDLPAMMRNQQAGIWDRAARFQREIRGLVVGLWGYGGIGRETARLAKAMGLIVHVLSRNSLRTREDIYVVPDTGDGRGVLPDAVFHPEQKKQFLSGLDFLILSMPLTKKTEGIVGEEELKALPNRAYLLNPARGRLVKEDSLLKALRKGWIAGAALDTHFYYPMPPDHPLWYFPNVIMTPHISGSSLSPHFQERIWDIFCQNVTRYLAGRCLLNELTPEQLNGE